MEAVLRSLAVRSRSISLTFLAELLAVRCFGLFLILWTVVRFWFFAGDWWKADYLDYDRGGPVELLIPAVIGLWLLYVPVTHTK